MHDTDIVYVILPHLGAGTHDVVHWGNAPNGIQHHAPLDDPASFINLLLILLCGLV